MVFLFLQEFWKRKQEIYLEFFLKSSIYNTYLLYYILSKKKPALNLSDSDFNIWKECPDQVYFVECVLYVLSSACQQKWELWEQDNTMLKISEKIATWSSLKSTFKRSTIKVVLEVNYLGTLYSFHCCIFQIN